MQARSSSLSFQHTHTHTHTDEYVPICTYTQTYRKTHTHTHSGGTSRIKPYWFSLLRRNFTSETGTIIRNKKRKIECREHGAWPDAHADARRHVLSGGRGGARREGHWFKMQQLLGWEKGESGGEREDEEERVGVGRMGNKMGNNGGAD